MTKEPVDGYIKKMSYIYKSVYVELQWWSWMIIFPSDSITVLFCVHTTVGIHKMMKSLNGTGLRTYTLSLWEVWCYTQKRIHMFLNYSGLTSPFLTLRICINNMHSVLIILWSLNFDLPGIVTYYSTLPRHLAAATSCSSRAVSQAHE